MKRVMVGGIDLIKALYFIVLTIVLGTLFALFVLRGEIVSYKRYNERIEFAKTQMAQAQSLLKKCETDLSSARQSHQALLVALGNTFDPERFKKVHHPEVEFVKLQEVNTTDEGNYTVRRFEATVRFESPDKLFAFFKSLDTGEYVVEVENRMQIGTNAGSLEADLGLLVYASRKVASPPPSVAPLADKNATHAPKSDKPIPSATAESHSRHK